MDPFIIGLIVGLTQLAKLTGLPSRFAPLCALVISLILMVVLKSGDVAHALINGLAAAGLYGGTKTTMGS